MLIFKELHLKLQLNLNQWQIMGNGYCLKLLVFATGLHGVYCKYK